MNVRMPKSGRTKLEALYSFVFVSMSFFIIGKKIGQNQSKIGRVWGKMGQNLEHCQKAEWVKIGAELGRP